MLTRLSPTQVERRISEVYGDDVPRTQWFLLGISDHPYLRCVDEVETYIFGEKGAGHDGLRLYMGDTPELKGQIVLRVTDAPKVIFELTMEERSYPIIRVGRHDQDDEPVVLLH